MKESGQQLWPLLREKFINTNEFSNQLLKSYTEDFAGLNLTKITTPEDFLNKQILDSINPLDQDKDFLESILSRKLLIDVGFGGGFPLLPIAWKLPEIKVIGIESINKKVEAVRQIALKNNLATVPPRRAPT